MKQLEQYLAANIGGCVALDDMAATSAFEDAFGCAISSGPA
jgi:hypothetical protein